MDLVRVAAILLVVLQHWVMPVVALHGDRLVTGNALSTPGWWTWTWIGQVMPLVFFAAGAANATAHSRASAGGTRRWLAGRVWRLGVPVLPLLLVWSVLPATLTGMGLPAQPVGVAASIVPQLLWFLGCYLLVLVGTPLARALHHRFGLRVIAALGAVALLVDALRFTGHPLLGYLNGVVVWLAVHQFGVAYTEDGPDALRRRASALALGGFCTCALLVAAGPYPASMIGMPGAPVSNMNPPTVCLLALGCFQVGLVLLLRPVLVRWVQRPRPALALRRLAGSSMTIYLWHMTALAVLVGVAVLGFGYATPAPGSAAWFAVLPVWLAAGYVLLRVLCLLFGRFERIAAPRAELPGPVALGAAVILLASGTLGVCVWGFAAPPPLLAGCVLAVVAGLALAAARWNRRLLALRVVALFAGLLDRLFPTRLAAGDEVGRQAQ